MGEYPNIRAELEGVSEPLRFIGEPSDPHWEIGWHNKAGISASTDAGITPPPPPPKK